MLDQSKLTEQVALFRTFCCREFTKVIPILTLVLFAGYGKTRGQPVSYSPLYNTGTFSNPINVSLAVGAVDGQSGVSQSGGASYTIPVKCPQGTGNMMPQISLSYNSMGGNGDLGMGWSISGLSAITRKTKNYFFNGIVAPIQYNNTDAYALDGTQLIDAGGGAYELEDYDFSTITAYGVTSSGPDHFVVVKKNGTVMEYGNTWDSRLVPGSGSVTLSWRLNKITDINGNYITFSYGSTGWESHITEIDYTGNAGAGLSPYNKITFSYATNRVDANRMYDANTFVDISSLLTGITVTGSGGAGYKSYALEYGTDAIESYLKSVTEMDGYGNQLNKTIFRYGNASAAFGPLNSLSGVPGFWDSDASLFTCDFNGDGLQDVVKANKATVSGIPYNTSLDVYTRDYTSSSYTWRSHINLPSTFEKFEGVTLPSNYSFQPADFNGDGFEDILITNGSYTGTEAWLTVNSFDISQGNPWAGYYGPTYYWQSYPPPSVGGYGTFNVISPHANAVTYPGDFNGDGICDFITILSNTTGFKAFMYQFNSSGGYTNHEISGLYYGAYSPWAAGSLVIPGTKLHVIDFNGDGKMELMVVSPNPGSTTYIYSFTDDGAGNFTAHTIYSAGYPVQDHDLYFGDFNGDGKTDMLTRIGSTYTSSNWQIANSTGTNWAVQPFTFVNTPQQHESIAIGDFNADGKSDVILKRNANNTSSTNYFDVYYALGCTPGVPPSFHLGSSAAYSMFCTSNMVTADLDGDGRTDIVNIPKNACMGGGPVEHTVSFFNRGQEQLLQGIIDGMGNATTFGYENLTSGANYTVGAGSHYPLNDFQNPMYTASTLIKPNGIGGTTATNYSYEGMVLHKTGRGILGFKKVTALNTTTNISTESDYSIHSVMYVPYLTHASTSQSSTALSDATYSYGFAYTGPGDPYYKTLGSSTEHNLVTGATKTTSIVYDGYTNPISTTVNNNGQETTVTTNTYVAAGTPVPAVVSSSTKTVTRAGSPPISDQTTYTYDSRGNVATEKSHASTTLFAQKTYTRNTFGNITTLQLNGGGVSTVPVYNYGYDATGRFATSTTLPGGQHESAAYDPLWSKPTSETDIMGNTTTYSYDSWGNLTTVNMPQGYTIHLSKGWNGSTPPSSQMWYSLVSHPGKPDEKKWHDALGREVLKEVETFGGAWTSVVTTYDALGNIATTTRPFKSGESPFTTTTTYNSLNQTISVSNPLGATTCSYTYSGGNTTVHTTDPGGHVTTKTTDATNKVISSTDAGGTQNFKYDGWGNLLSSLNFSYPMVTNTYDAAGRMASSNDVDGGTTTYVYDAFGRPKTQTDAASNTVNFFYDGLSRLITKTGTEGTTSYSYPATSTGINTPSMVTAPSGVTDQYTYDAFGRQTQHIKTVGSSSFTTSQAYDAYDNVTSITYPSGIIVYNGYDANSFPLNVNTGLGLGSVNVFNAISMNGQGQYTQYSLGNGLTTTKGYISGLPVNYSTPGVQDYDIVWDYANGNVIRRGEWTVNRKEDFTYDALNRLTSSTVSNIFGPGLMYPAISLTYNTRGNITSKTDVGTMSYGQWGGKMHAVSTVADAWGDISHLRQRINYTPFHKASKVMENGYTEDITYDADHNRVMAVLKNGTTIINTRYFLDNCEYNVPGTGSPYYVNYIYGGDGLAAISYGTNIITVSFLGFTLHVPAPACYFTYKDQQGSIVAVTDKTGAVVARQNFDAWGRYRNPTSWSYMSFPYSSPGTPVWLYRGYTGHEHIPQFDLINMNGRMYDPVLSRMLRPDNYIQNPYGTQSYNRYTYCMNNPLKYTDPTGDFYFWDDVLVAGVGFTVGYVGEALATGNWASKEDLESGALGAVIAEGCYLTFGGAAVAAAGTEMTAATEFAVGYGMSAGMSMVSNQKQIAAANKTSTDFKLFGGKVQLNDGLLFIGGLELISGIGQGLSQTLSSDAAYSMKAFRPDWGAVASNGFTSFSTTILQDSYHDGKWGGLTWCDVGQAGEGAFGDMAANLVGQLVQYKCSDGWNSMGFNKRYAQSKQWACPSNGSLISSALNGAKDAFHAGGWIGGITETMMSHVDDYWYNNITSHEWSDLTPLLPFDF